MYHVRLTKKKSIHFPTRSLVVLHRVFLESLVKSANHKQRLKALLGNAQSSQLKALVECCRNILQNNIPVRKPIIQKLTPFKQLIRKISKSPSNTKKATAVVKRLLLKHNNQTGGLPFLVPLLAPVLGTLLSAGIDAAIRKK